MEFESGTVNPPTFLYRFLVSPRYRIGRHVLLIGALIVISFNQTFMSYQESLYLLGSRIYWIVSFVLLTYAGVVYFNLYYLLPKYLLSKRYASYIVLLSVAMIIALLAQMLQEYVVSFLGATVRMQEHFFSLGTFMDYVSAFLLDMLCMMGGTVTVLLKLWIVDNQRVTQLEKIHTQSEVEQLKERVSPELLFKTLNCSGRLALTDPGKASKMLMKLSQLLRYQLYDCSREKVLLSTELSFLANYLILEKLYSDRFEYTLSSGGEISFFFIPPLLFIPFVQYTVGQIYVQNTGHTTLHIHVEAEGDTVVFTCVCADVSFSAEDSLGRIRQRLNIQYGEQYDLLLSPTGFRLELKGGGR